MSKEVGLKYRRKSDIQRVLNEINHLLKKASGEESQTEADVPGASE
ncbi:MAG TPA: hypothetical protein VKK79_24605 [Candidatus Lokiarchaeia archaeon]|nr:hypothetical protein [Candidatus Lokiarchaeia archaeon]